MKIFVAEDGILTVAVRTDDMTTGTIAQEAVGDIAFDIPVFTLFGSFRIPDMRVMTTRTAQPAHRGALTAAVENRHVGQ